RSPLLDGHGPGERHHDGWASPPEHGHPGLHRPAVSTPAPESRMGEHDRVATDHHGREDREPFERESRGSRDLHDLLQQHGFRRGGYSYDQRKLSPGLRLCLRKPRSDVDERTDILL